MDYKLPNFLIVGAHKSGTTSLCNYLAQHPQVYISKKKEPHFLISEYLNLPWKGPEDIDSSKNICTSFKKYLSLFKPADSSIKAIGESSVFHLYYYKEAIPKIKKILGAPKIIIILRNPIQRAFSNYSHLRKEGREKFSFEKAIKEESHRKEKNYGPFWRYTEASFYYQQVKAYLEEFPEVRIYLTEELINNSKNMLKDIFTFLEVDPSYKINTNIKYNISGIPRSIFIQKMLIRPNLIAYALRLFTTKKQRDKLRAILNKLNTRKRKTTILPETHQYLRELYKDDIIQLQSLIGRDLSGWLK